MKIRMIITFSNRKGGVGKSSLCAAFANYLSTNSYPVRVVDVDPQQSLFYGRADDLKKHDGEDAPKYEIIKFDLSLKADRIQDYLLELKKSDVNTLFDPPGGMDSDIIMYVLLFSDFIIVPFQYETFSLDSTGRYARALKKLKETYQELHRTAIFVPNMVDPRIGKADERKFWEEWDERIQAVGNESPRVPLRACIQRLNTLCLTPEQETCLSPCLDYLKQAIFSNHIDSTKSL